MPGFDKRSGPLVLHIRMGGRLVPLAAALLVFALLPFLGGSASGPPATSVVLAAGSPAAVQDAVDAVGQARDELAGLDHASTTAVAPPGPALASAVGGGLFLFPAVSLAPVTAVAAPLTGLPFFIHPVSGGETSPFGPRIHPLLGRPMFHTGIDLAAACGTPIRAAADGTVIYARVSASWGGRTIIQHTPTVKTAYGHQSKFLVTEGQQVKQGQVIGLSGTTGWSTGCHLHFDVIVDDRYVDPAPYLGFPPSTAASVPYAAVPQLSLDQGGQLFQTVQDGDVPITAASVVPLPPGTAPPLPPPLTSSVTSPATTSAAATPRTSAAGTTTPAPASSTTSGTPATSSATTPPAPASSTPPSPTSSTPQATTTTPPAPTSTTPAPTTSTPPATQPSSTTTVLATTTGATCPTGGTSGSSPTTTTTTPTTTDPACPTQAPAPGG